MWKILAHSKVYSGRYLDVFEERCALPNNAEITYSFAAIPSWVAAVVLSCDRKILLVHQYRHPARRELWDLPAGFINDGESPETAIRRELKEETGLEIDGLVPLGRQLPLPGKVDNSLFLYRASVLPAATSQKLDAEEAGLRTEWFDLADFLRGVRAGELQTSMTTLGAITLAGCDSACS